MDKKRKPKNNSLKELGIKSKPAYDALYKSGSGVHVDQLHRYNKRDRGGKHKKEDENVD